LSDSRDVARYRASERQQAERSEARSAQKKAAVEMVRQGMSVKEIAEQLGMSVRTWDKWRNQDPAFGVAVDAARAGAKEVGNLADYSGDFASFRKVFLGMDTYVHQQQLVKVLNEAQSREIVLVNIFPEAGKTTTITDWIVYTLANDPNHRITIVSESMGLARKIVGQVQRRLANVRDFPELVGRFGPFYSEKQEKQGKPWTRDYFTVWRADHDERDYSLEARGWNSSTYGTRIDTLIVDDVQSRESINQTEQMLASLRQTYFTRGRRMRTVIVGTRIAPGDIYERLVSEGIVTKHIELPVANADGTPVCPEWWENDLDKSAGDYLNLIRQQVGEEVWWASYMQRPHDNALATFTDEMIDDCRDMDRPIARARTHRVPVVGSLDPALGGQNAIIVTAHHPDKLEVLDLDSSTQLARTEQIFTKIADMSMSYAVQTWVIEQDALQKGMVNDDRLRDLGRELGFRVVPHTTSRRKSDPIMGVAAMAGSFLRQEVRLPFGDSFARAKMELLATELRNWRPNVSPKLLRQDLVMALWFNWKYWRELLPHGGANSSSAWTRPGLPWSPSGYRQSGARSRG